MARFERAIAERARRQLGLITYRQLDEIGISRQRRRTLLTKGLVVPAGRRVVHIAGLPPRWEAELLAACLDAGEGAVASHRAAGALWKLHDLPPGTLELSVLDRRRPAPTAALVHRVTRLDPIDVTRIGPIPVTTPARTLIDLARFLEPGRLEEAVDHALRDRRVTYRQLQRRLTALRSKGRAGVAQLDEILMRCGDAPSVESWLERAMLRLLRRAGLPDPTSQLTLHLANGRSVRIDLAYEHSWLAIEVDGHGSHSTRQQRQADAEREATLVAAGWRVVRFTYEDVTERPGYVVATVKNLLGMSA